MSFDPNPRELEKSTNGFIWCEACEAPQSAAGHDCKIAPQSPETGQGSESDERIGHGGRKLSEMTHAELLEEALWSRQILDGIWDGAMDCAVCGGMTTNGICTGCRRGTSPMAIVTVRAEFAESLLCALAFDHALIFPDHSCPTWAEFGEDGHCVFCESAR